MESELEVEMELVYEWIADAEEDFLAEALEDAWFQRSEEMLAEVEDAPVRERTLGGRVMRLIGFQRDAA